MLGSGDNDHLHIRRNTYRDHAAAHLRPQTNARIESLGDNIDEAAFTHQLQPDIGIALLKYRELWQEAFINGVLAGIDAHRAGRGLTIVRQRGKPRI